MRIALLIAKWTTRGGNERVAVELAELLTARGHDVEVYCQKIEHTGGTNVHLLRGVRFDPALSMLSFARAAKKKLAELRAQRAIDVAFGFNHSIEQDVYRLGGGTHAEYLELSPKRSPLLDRLALRLERRRFESTPRLIAPSRRVRDELLRHYAIDPARIAVIPNGIDLTRFRPITSDADRAERQNIRREWRVPEDSTRVVLFAGHDLHRKGFSQAIEAARRTKATLIAIGKADRPKDLPDFVVWDGERRDIDARYRAADALILPSHYDPFGGVVLEAIACGLPAVATRRIGSTELCAGTPLDRLLVESPDDVDALARCLDDALDPTHRTTWLAAAREVARDAGRDRWVTRIEEVLRSAATR